MQKIFNTFIEIVYWLAIFASPLLPAAFIGLAIYIKDGDLLWLSVVIASIGLIAGILFAERARKKYGYSNYLFFP